MYKKELEKAAADAWINAGTTVYGGGRWTSVVDALVPLITEAIADTIRDEAYKTYVDVDGENKIIIHKDHDGMIIAQTIVRLWKPDEKE